MDDSKNRLKNLKNLIGNTPLIQINFKYKGHNLKVFSKLEYYNYTGSIKDRVALYILQRAITNNKIHKNSSIVEATSGNTGISFAAIGTYLNYPVHIYMPDWLSSERINLLKSFNANLHLISKKDGGFKKCIQLTYDIKKQNPAVFLPQQFSNIDNVYAHYYSTAPEICSDLTKHNLKPNAFVAGVGTGGTVMGIGKYLKQKFHSLKLYPLEPSNSKTLTNGTPLSSHRIQGISDEFIPPILDLNYTDRIISVDDGDSIIMSQMLSKKLGLGVGISSGANFLGAIRILELNNFRDMVVVTVFSDDNKKYLSTDLMKDEPIKNDFISKNVELLGLKTL